MILKRLILIVVLGLSVLAATPSWAQNNLPADIVTATDLNDGQRSTLKQFVDAHKAGLGEGHAAITKSRNALIEPLLNPAVSVSFRLEYARLLTPVLRPLASGDRELNAINAVRLAGELATTSGLEILSDGLKDTRAAVRFRAVSGFTSTFTAIETTAPAVAPAQQAIRAVTTLKSNMDKEADARVMEAYVLALQAASKVPSGKVQGLRSEAIKSLSQSIGAKAQKASDATFDAAYRRAANATRNALTVQAINEPALDREILKEAAGMAGDLLACVYRRVQAGELTAKDGEDPMVAKHRRSDFVLIVADSERTIQWANTGMGGANAPDLKLSELLQQEKDEQFVKDVMRVIGASGLLQGAPFSFAKDRFVK